MPETINLPRPVNVYLTANVAQGHPTDTFPFCADTVAIDTVMHVLQYGAKAHQSENATRIPPHPAGISSQGLDIIIGASTKACVDSMVNYIDNGVDVSRLYMVEGNKLTPTTISQLYASEVPKIGIMPDEHGRVSGTMLAADLLGLDPHSLENTHLLNSGDSPLANEAFVAEKRALLQRVTPHLPLAILRNNHASPYLY